MLTNIVLSVLLGTERKIQVTTHPVILTDVTPCVRRLEVEHDSKRGFGAQVTGPDGHRSYVSMDYGYAQVWTYRSSGKKYASLDFSNVWGTDVTTSLGIACNVRRAFFFVINYPEPRPNTPLPYWPGNP